MKKNLFYLVLLLISTTSFAQLSGIYTVGPTGNFTTPNEAIQALNAQGISGTVTFNIQPGTYDVSASIEKIQGSSFTDKVIFTSSTNNANDVILEHSYSTTAPYLLQIDTAGHIVFQNLTFNPINYNKAIEIIQTVDLTISDCIFFRDAQSSYYGSGGFINKYSSNEGVIDSIITIENNYFEKGNIGVQLYAFGTSIIYDVNLNNNTFYEQGYGGCKLSNIYNFANINNNKVFSSYDDVAYGMYLDRINNTNVSIANNDIKLIADYGNTTNWAIGLALTNSTVQTSTQLYNNIVYVSNLSGVAYGIYISNGSNNNVQFNTCIVDGINETSALFFRFASQNYVVQNNNFVNFGSGYAFRTYDTHDPSSEINTFDYNNCYTNGTFFCRWVGNDYSLQDFRTATSYAFLNHLTQIPASAVVTDNNYAYSCSNALVGTGIDNPNIQIDYNNVSRPNPPSVGAIEYQDTSFNLIDAQWLNSCGADTNNLMLTEVTTPEFTNQWIFNNDTIAVDSTNLNYFVNNSGTLSLQITHYTCTLKDSVYLSVDTMPVVDLGSSTEICENNPPLLLSVDSVYTSYIWSTSDTTNNILVTATDLGLGTSDVYVTVVNGACITEDSIQITYDELPIVNLGNDTTLCENESYTLDAGSGYTYIWSTGETSSFITVDTTILGTGTSMVYVTVTNGNCIVEDSVQITFNICSNIETSSQQNIFIYPNPAHNYITIQNPELKIKNIEILDITGKTVKQSKIQNSEFKIQINDLQNGMYFIKINNTETLKFIKD